ncbi:PAS domain S-box protein [Candidatus Poribacteria bacterium]|nr:PAS domain S-box protein [Candidatus Poribacteria bacterium]
MFMSDEKSKKEIYGELLCLHYKNAIEIANSLVVGLDSQGYIILFNSFAEKTTGYKREEVFGKSWFDLFIPEDEINEIKQVFKEVKNTEQPSTTENKIISRDGNELLIVWSNSQIKDESGEITGILSYGIDVTQQRMLESQLSRSERMSALGQLVSGVAHELNNPLTAVIGYTQLLVGVDCDSETRRMLNIIYREAERCHKIVDGLLQFAREYDQVKEPTQINDVIEATLNLKRYQLHVDNIQLELHLSGDIPETMADPHQLQQVFVNLINNAHQAMTDHSGRGKLTIQTELIDDKIVVKFIDTGPGIVKDNLSRIFDPFFTTKESGKGTGLGLSICHSIIEEHNGNIYAESEIGKGSTFTLVLPVVTSDEIPDNVINDANIEQMQDSVFGGKILVVDDEQKILELFNDILTMMNYEVVTARNAIQAMDNLDNNEYDLMICDMKMPGFSGEKLYNIVKSTKPDLAERIIFVTGDIINPDTQKFLRETGNPYIAKPFSVDEIKDIVFKSFSTEKI